jgi:hypothetical protein
MIHPHRAAETAFPGIKSEKRKNSLLEKPMAVFPPKRIIGAAFTTNHVETLGGE